MADDRRGAIVPGVILVALGLALLAAQFVPGLGGEVVLLGLGAAFLAVGFYQRAYGLLIPGCILTGLGTGIAAGDALGGELVVVGLGLGFIAIWVIDRLYTRASNWWPLIPGGILLTVGIAIALPDIAPVVVRLWPIVLIVIGVALVAVALGRGRGAH